jgi:ABC-type polysaccharide/polyol phosphate export permease
MSEKQITPINSGILTIMFVVFVTLKLTGNIDWSWWWVTSPLWLPVAILFFVLSVLFIAGIITLYSKGK